MTALSGKTDPRWTGPRYFRVFIISCTLLAPTLMSGATLSETAPITATLISASTAYTAGETIRAKLILTNNTGEKIYVEGDGLTKLIIRESNSVTLKSKTIDGEQLPADGFWGLPPQAIPDRGSRTLDLNLFQWLSGPTESHPVAVIFDDEHGNMATWWTLSPPGSYEVSAEITVKDSHGKRVMVHSSTAYFSIH